nr:conjugation system SOS inhibitor PsiB family protein [Enterobacter chengduensis]
MQYDLNRINTLTASDLEFIRHQGEDARRALSDAVTGLLSTPEGWRVCAEFRSEFGGFFPVQRRFQPVQFAFLRMVVHTLLNTVDTVCRTESQQGVYLLC